MTPTITTPNQSLNPAFLKQSPNREDIELFRKEFNTLFDRINAKGSEEFHKNLIKDNPANWSNDEFYMEVEVQIANNIKNRI